MGGGSRAETLQKEEELLHRENELLERNNEDLARSNQECVEEAARDRERRVHGPSHARPSGHARPCDLRPRHAAGAGASPSTLRGRRYMSLRARPS